MDNMESFFKGNLLGMRSFAFVFLTSLFYLGVQPDAVRAQFDTNPPTVTVSASTAPSAEGWYAANTTITLTATDAESGVASVEYQWNDGAWVAGTTTTIPGEGIHTLAYRATDLAGNVSANLVPLSTLVTYDAEGVDPLTEIPVTEIKVENGNNVYSHTNGNTILGSDFIPVDTAKRYHLTGKFKSAGSGGLSKLYFGLSPYDANQDFISAYDVLRRGNEVVVSSVSDTAVDVEQPLSGWCEDATGACFNWHHRSIGIYYDGDTTKLPDHVHFTVSTGPGAYSTAADGATRITLNTSIPANIVANIVPGTTVIKNHYSGMSYLYSAATNLSLPTTWTEITENRITGEGFGYDQDMFRIGTEFVRVLFLLNFSPTNTPDFETLFDDVVFSEVNQYRLDTTAPTQEDVTVSSSDWMIDGSSAYDITVVGSDAGSGVRTMRTVVNLQGANNANPRGYFSWNELGYLWNGTDSADRIECVGGGYADKYNGDNGAPVGYGKDYVTLTGCSTSLEGDTRTVTFTVQPHADFGDFNDNDVSLWIMDRTANASNWQNFDLNFVSDGTPPIQENLTVSSSDWQVDGVNTYDITLVASDGGSGIKNMRAQINRDGDNSANPRGLFIWKEPSYPFSEAQRADAMECLDPQGNPDGYAAKNGVAYGYEHITLTGCSTTLSGGQRSVTFTVQPHESFGGFANNDVSFFVRDHVDIATGWVNYDLNFSSTVTSSLPGTNVYIIGGTVQLDPADSSADIEGGFILPDFTSYNETVQASSSGAFNFVNPLPQQAVYDVTAASTTGGCSVANDSGLVGSSDVSDISVDCRKHDLDIVTTGLASGNIGLEVIFLASGLTPRVESLTISANGVTTIPNIANNSDYEINVQSYPGGQTCTMGNAESGTISGQDVDVSLNCEPGFTIGGTTSSLASGGTITIAGSFTLPDGTTASESIAVGGDSSFQFSTPLPNGSQYEVAGVTAPGECFALNGEGTISGANVGDIVIACSRVSIDEFLDKIRPPAPCDPFWGPSPSCDDPPVTVCTNFCRTIGFLPTGNGFPNVIYQCKTKCNPLGESQRSPFASVRANSEVVSGDMEIEGWTTDVDIVQEIIFVIDSQIVTLDNFSRDQLGSEFCDALGQAGEACNSNNKFSGTFDTTQLSDGEHVLQVISIDEHAENPRMTLVETTFTVDNSNQAPNAVNDSASTSQNTAVIINVLANDSDPNNDSLTLSIESNPSDGSVAIVANSIRYTPDNDFVGTDSFTYGIDDGNGGTDTATVNITVTCETTSPTITLTNPTNGTSHDPQYLTLAATASDDTAIDRVEFFVNGSLTSTVTSAPYTNNYWFGTQGAQTITATAYDQCGNSASDTATITITRDAAPCDINTDPPTGAITFPANNASVPSGQITLTASATDDVTVQSVVFEINGTIPDANVDMAPPYEYVWDAAPGTYSIRAKVRDVCDLIGYSAPITVTVTDSTPGSVPNFQAKINSQGIAGLTVYETAPTINFTWNTPSAPAGVDYYRIVLKETGENPWLYDIWSIQGTSTSYNLTTANLEYGKSYITLIQACWGNNTGPVEDDLCGSFASQGDFTVTEDIIPRSWIDFPGQSSTQSGTIAVYGWALDESLLSSANITFLMDGVPVTLQSFVYGIGRADVCAANSDAGSPNCDSVGWNATLDTTAFANGVRELKMIVTDATGNQYELPRSFTISN